ncbi:hypothetical protein [Methylohalobius crimeensis]|uniref:hypothetical protein n=1 Tax=Methylohalobius crimeensis TaxID=244365 RepID=UPI0003B552C4|nr:hypothetical protein [Methylohalobius crimeensis]
MTDFIPLNPADHVLLVMDREIRAAGLPGAWCGFALELAGPPDEDRLRSGLAALGEAFPMLSARLAQRGRHYGWQPTGDPVPLTCHPPSLALPPAGGGSGGGQSRLLELMHASPEGDETAPFSLHRIDEEGHTLLLARWLHPLMDAGGVKRVFDFLMADDDRRRRYLKGDEPLVSKKLNAWPWRRKLRLLWRGKRHNDWIDRLDSSLPTSNALDGAASAPLPCPPPNGERVGGSLALPPLGRGLGGGKPPGKGSRRPPAALAVPSPRQLNTALLTLSEEETRTVTQATRRRVGLGAQSLYPIGCLMRALEAMGPAVSKDAWCIPYAFNLRPGNAPVPVTGNQVSVLFAQASHDVVADRDRLFEHLRRQYADTVRRELDQAYLPLMWLGRWLSLERYAHILRRQKSGGERSSVWFSDIGEIRFLRPDFLGAPIEGVRHACFVTAPPSLAVLFSRFNGQLSAAINYLQPDFDPTWIERFRDLLRSELLAD